MLRFEILIDTKTNIIMSWVTRTNFSDEKAASISAFSRTKVEGALS